MIRKFKFTPDAYYHICNRSNDQKSIFLDEKDYARFLFFILYCQAPLPFYNLSRQTSYFVKHSTFNVSTEITNQVTSQRKVCLNGFAIMPNHFHIFAQEKAVMGISRYLHRVQTGYAKYFNTKYKKQGHLFQGSFRAVPVETDEQLLYLSAYIHRNPRELKEWENREARYRWSSYQDYINENRWGQLLKTEIVLNQFSSPKSYRDFVQTSTAKLKQGEPLAEELLLD